MKRAARNNRFVITGGPGAGKTTVLRELEARGFHSVSEVARQLIQEQVRVGGTALPWADRTLYARRMLERSIQSYQEHTPDLIPTFFDRGIPDTLGYARLIGLRDETFIRNACDQYRYEPIVFSAPAWKEIYETDSERKQDFAEAEQTCALLVRIYQECGYEVLEIPRASAQERAEFIVKHVRKATAPRARGLRVRSRANA
jgi:predicted ATPase